MFSYMLLIRIKLKRNRIIATKLIIYKVHYEIFCFVVVVFIKLISTQLVCEHVFARKRVF
jgi:hypothetical protein